MALKYKNKEPWLFWLREYLHRASNHHGCDPVFLDYGRPSSEETLRILESHAPITLQYEFLGSFNPFMLFKAVMPYVWHRDGASQNTFLEPVFRRFGPDSDVFKDIEPVIINYSSGKERAIKEIEALFHFKNGDYDDGVICLFVDEYKNKRDVVKNTTRAVGLWLFDMATVVDNNGQIVPKGVANAIKKLGDNFDLDKLGIYYKEPTDYHFYLKNSTFGDATTVSLHRNILK